MAAGAALVSTQSRRRSPSQGKPGCTLPVYPCYTAGMHGLSPRLLEAGMLSTSCLGPPTCAKAGWASASRLGRLSRAKSALSAAVAIGIVGLTTGCQSQGQIASQGATISSNLDVTDAFALALRANQDALPSLLNIDSASADNPPSISEAQPTPAAPGPLPIFGAAAAFGASRQLRRRIKASATKPTKG